MADYNVNMKQWNGTSFDNVLPLAYNAKQLEGQSLAEVKQWVKQWVQDNNLLLYTGQYTGTGTYGSSNPTSITFPFEPILLIGPHTDAATYNMVIICGEIPTDNYMSGYWFAGQGYTVEIKKSANGKTITWFSSDSSNQCNNAGSIYHFVAIGGHDMGGQTEWTITSSGTWTVPRTGRYMLELYGGGGYGAQAANTMPGIEYLGGSSCQTYEAITLNEGEAISVVVGTSGNPNNGVSPTGTQFGSYGVAAGGNATSTSGGVGVGNKGTTTSGGYNAYDDNKNYSNGKFGKLYGYGSGYQSSSGAGAVYIKYLGA